MDTTGARSKQTDVVVVTDDHPRIYDEEQASLFLIEGVCAAGEVKSVLTAGSLESSAEAAYEFKRLQGRPGDGSVTRSNPSDLSRFGTRPPYFLFALESQLDREGIGRVMKSILSKHSVDKVGGFDGILVLDQGFWANLHDGQGSYAVLQSDGKLATGWQLHSSEHRLFQFLAWLTAVMPRILRFQPILPQYMLLSGSIADISKR